MIKSVIIGTAGHIDHGKTSLVKALTGIDADRLKEEKRRGITIDIGFAHMEMTGLRGQVMRFGFVDVPGHERFVRNMLAGIGGIDIVLLVVAADESIKPQTCEHFDICRLLSIPRGVTVVTKIDLVDGETLEVVKMELEEYLSGSFLDPEKAPIIPVSSFTGDGMDALKRALIQSTGDIPAKDATQFARLPIDRVFVIRGFGTVVTGTLIAGCIKKDEELEVFPGGRRVRVRGIQNHNTPAAMAVAGQRTALNLAGVNAEELARGMMLAPPGLFRNTSGVDVEFSLLKSAKPLKNRARVHFYAYSSEIVAEVVLYSGNQIAPGNTVFAQLRTANPMLLLPGDRFIVRQLSPVVTIGGGMVLNAFPARKRKKFHAAETNTYLETLLYGTKTEILKTRISRQGPKGISLDAIIAETGWRRDQIESALSQLSDSVIRFKDVLIARPIIQQLRSEVLGFLDDFHSADPLLLGIAREELREKLRVSHPVFAGILEILISEKKIEISGELVHMAGRGAVMKDEEAEAKMQIEQAFERTGLRVPLLKDVLAGLKVDAVRARKILYLLLRDGVLVRLDEDIVMHRRALDDLHRRLVQYKIGSASINIAKFKDLTGVSRRYAIALLEYLDRRQITARIGNERIIL